MCGRRTIVKKRQVAGLNKLHLKRDSNYGSFETAFGRIFMFRFFQIEPRDKDRRNL